MVILFQLKNFLVASQTVWGVNGAIWRWFALGLSCHHTNFYGFVSASAAFTKIFDNFSLQWHQRSQAPQWRNLNGYWDSFIIRKICYAWMEMIQICTKWNWVFSVPQCEDRMFKVIVRATYTLKVLMKWWYVYHASVMQVRIRCKLSLDGPLCYAPCTEVLDSFCTAMASTQPSHSTPTGLRLAEQRNLRDPDTYIVK